VPPVFFNARMYSATAAAKRAWTEVLEWAIARAALPWSHFDHDAPKPLAELWARADLGCALMCGLPYSQRHPRPTLVAAPVPSPARYRGKPVYFTDIAVRQDAPYKRLEDTFGGVIGYTLRDSLSGYVALRSQLLSYRTASRGPLYRRVVGGLTNARSVIEALVSGQIDVGPLDSYYHDLLEDGDPELASKVRVIATSAAAPIPPFVATAPIAAADLTRLRAALEAAARAPELAEPRATLLLERFAVPAEADYDVIRPILENAARYPETWAEDPT
jgi:ABC-type phosphate/phosphonate transport system substrate-binding protein